MIKTRFNSQTKPSFAIKKYFIDAAVLIACGIIASQSNDFQRDTITAKVVSKQTQQKISGGGETPISTEIRYLIATNKETFICENSLVNGKFNNSDIYMRLDTGKTYVFKVCGFGKGMFFDYRNILSAEQVAN